MDARHSPAADPVGPLTRGLEVLRTLAAAPGHRLRAGDIARATGLARATTDRVLATLTALGFVRAELSDFVLAPTAMCLGNAFLAANALAPLLNPHAVRLADRLDESVSLAIADREAVRFISQSPRRRAMSLAFRIGDRLPAERCAAGTLFAASWDQAHWTDWRRRAAEDPQGHRFPVLAPPAESAAPHHLETDFAERAAHARRHGWALDDGLAHPGLIAVALPIRDPDGHLACALSVVSHTSRHTAHSLAQHALSAMRETAAAMESALATADAGAPSGAVDLWVPAPPAPAATVANAERLASLKEEHGADFLQSLARGLAVAAAMRTPGGDTLAHLAARVGQPRATTRRTLLSLAALGYAAPTQDPARHSLLPSVFDLGYTALSRLTLDELIQPHLVTLARVVQDSASAAVLDGAHVRYIARTPITRVMSVDIAVGTRLPAHATSLGRVLLADHSPAQYPPPLAAVLEDVRRDGFALVDQELEEGLRSVAMPIRARDGHAIAAINVARHASRGSIDDLRATVIPALRRTVHAIEDELSVMTEQMPPSENSSRTAADQT
jgi:IclR family pca regulon transcriptional regulator